MKTVGELCEPRTMMLRFAVGDATAKDGTKYELSTDAGSRPVVRNEKTGVWFVLSWQDIINLAKESGIDKPWKKAKGIK